MFVGLYIFCICFVLATVSNVPFFNICDSRNNEEPLTGNGYILTSNSISGPINCRLNVSNVLGGSVKFKLEVFDVGDQYPPFKDAHCNQRYLAINSERFCGGLSSYEHCTSDDWITLDYYLDENTWPLDRFQIYFETFSANQCDCMSEEPDSRKCVFPFIFNDKTHYQCTSEDGGDGGEVKPFCATAVDSLGRAISVRDCNMSHPGCAIKCLTNEGRQCLFAYSSSQHQTCITNYNPYEGAVPEPSCPVGKHSRTNDPVYETCGDQCLMEKQPGSAEITDKKGRVGAQVTSETAFDSDAYFTFNSQNDSIHYLLVFTQLQLHDCPDYGVLTIVDFEGLFRYHICSFTGDLCIPSPKFFIHYNVTSGRGRNFMSNFSAEFTQVPKSECEYVEPIDSACSESPGRLVTVPGWIRSPLYPLALPSSVSCHWVIESPGEDYLTSVDIEGNDLDVGKGTNRYQFPYGSFEIWDDEFLNETIKFRYSRHVSVSRFVNVKFTGSSSFYEAGNFKFQVEFLRKETDLMAILNNGFVISEDGNSLCNLPFSVNGTVHEGCFVSSDSNDGERDLKCLSTDGESVTCHSAEPFLRPYEYRNHAYIYNVWISSINNESFVNLNWSISSAFYKSIQIWVNNKLSTSSTPGKVEGLSLTEMNKIELVVINIDHSTSHSYLHVDIQSGLYVTDTLDLYTELEFNFEFASVNFSEILIEAYTEGLSQATIDALKYYHPDRLTYNYNRTITGDQSTYMYLDSGGPVKITVQGLDTKVSFPMVGLCDNFRWIFVSINFHKVGTLLVFLSDIFEFCFIELIEVELLSYKTSNSSLEEQRDLIVCSWDNGCLTTPNQEAFINSTMIDFESCIQVILIPSTFGMKQGMYTEKVCPPPENLHIINLTQTSATLNWKVMSGFTGYFTVYVWSPCIELEEARVYRTKNSFLHLVNLKPGNRYEVNIRPIGYERKIRHMDMGGRSLRFSFETIPSYLSQLSYKNGNFHLEWAVLSLDDGITTDNSVYSGFQVHYSSASSENVTHTFNSTHIQSFQLNFEVLLELYTIKLQSMSCYGNTLGEERVFHQLSGPGEFETSNFFFRDLTQESFVLKCNPELFTEPHETETRYSFEVEYISAVTGSTAHKFCDSDSLTITLDDIKHDEDILTIRAKGTNPMSHFVNVYSVQSWSLHVPYLKTNHFVSFPDPTLYDSPNLILQFDLSSYGASIEKILISVYNLDTSDSALVQYEIEGVLTGSKVLDQTFSTGSYLLKTSIVIWSTDSDLVVSFPDYFYSPKELFKVTNATVSQTSINVEVDPSESLFLQYPLVFTHFHIAVSKSKTSIEVPETAKFPTWKQASRFANSEEDFYYQTTVWMSNPPEISVDVQSINGFFVFRIGALTSEVCNEVSEESVCNGPLLEDTTYFVHFICESSDGDRLKSEAFGPYKTSKLLATPSHHSSSNSTSKLSPAGIVFLVLFLISLLVIAALTALYVFRRRLSDSCVKIKNETVGETDAYNETKKVPLYAEVANQSVPLSKQQAYVNPDEGTSQYDYTNPNYSNAYDNTGAVHYEESPIDEETIGNGRHKQLAYEKIWKSHVDSGPDKENNPDSHDVPFQVTETISNENQNEAEYEPISPFVTPNWYVQS